MSVQPQPTSLFPFWTVEDLLDSREPVVALFTQNKEVQDKEFEKNYATVAKKIAETFAEKMFENFKTHVMNPESNTSHKLGDSIEFHICYIRNVNNSFKHLMEYAKETAELAPFAEWKKGIHYYTGKEEYEIVLNKFVRIKAAVVDNLNTILSDFQKISGNSCFQFSVNQQSGPYTLRVEYWVDSSKRVKKHEIKQEKVQKDMKESWFFDFELMSLIPTGSKDKVD